MRRNILIGEQAGHAQGVDGQPEIADTGPVNGQSIPDLHSATRGLEVAVCRSFA